MDVDNQSEDGEIKRSPENFSEEEGADTADSLEIKPPQAVVRHRKPTSHRRDEHPSRRDRRDDKERKSRHHVERIEDPSNRHREKHSSRHRRPSGEVPEKVRRSDPVKREREPSRHERKERSTGDRVLEDLRERLLDKRRERRDDSHEYKIESSSRSRDEARMNDSRGERREIRIEEMRDRREVRMVEEVPQSRDRREPRIEGQRISGSHKHMVYQDVEMIDPARISEGREKRHKRSHKHERTRNREREREKEIAREKYVREQQAMEIEDDYEELEALAAKQQQQLQQHHHHHHHHHQQMTSLKDPKEMTEQELRRQRLLDAEREMARRKENSRLELEARRKMRGEKRNFSPGGRDPSVVELSDESEHVAANSDGGSSRKSSHSRLSEEIRDPERERSDKSSSSSSDTSTDDDDSNDSNKDSDSGDNSDYNNPSPLSVDQLAKSDRSDMGSPGHVESNGATKVVANNEEKSELELQLELPPYFPAIQGCRSVEEYRCLNRIAEGTYGVVYRAEDRRTKEIVALKRLKMEKEKDGFPITSLREINTLLKAQHPNIVTVREIVVGSNMDKIFIVMDYVEHDLKSLMETMQTKSQYFVPREIKCLMQQLLRAVAHLHDNWILHRDLKTSNLLLSHSGILKVGDFGLAREYGSPLKQYTSIVVTLWYRAPELLLGCKEYSTPIDVWSVGCIFAELLSMKALFPGKSEIDLLNRVFKELGTPNDKIWPGYSKLPMVKKIPFATYPVNSLKQRFSLTLTDSGLDLLNKFLTYNPAQRITAEDAVKHPYFSEAPLAIDPAMFPTWPAKSEFGAKVNASPKPPSGGKEFKDLNEDDDDGDMGFHMGSKEAARQPMGGGFALRF